MCHFRQGGSETRANWAFAGICPGNPYSTRALDLLPVAAVICLHCALSASASARGGLNVYGVRTSTVAVRPQRLPGSPRLLGVSDRAALEPAPIGRLRAGTPETLILRRFRSLGFFIYSTIALQKGVDAGIWLLPAAETLTATVVVVALSAVTASVFLGRLGSQKSIFCVQRF